MYIEQFFIEDDQYLQFLIFTPLGLRTILAHWVEIHSELAFLSKLKKYILSYILRRPQECKEISQLYLTLLKGFK